MNSKKSIVVGVVSLCLGLGLATQVHLAGAEEKQQTQAAGSEPIVNDYSGGGEAYDGPRPENHITKGYRNAEESADASKSSEPIVNDYSSMGADYGSTSAGPATNGPSSITVGPTLNDYSSMGEEYGAGTGTQTSQDSGQTVAEAPEPGDFSKTDLIVGHEKYHGNCAQCHGEDAVGSTFAPSLVKRLQKLSYAEFVDVITNGKTVLDTATGGYSVMPAWQNNPAVMAHVNELWAYLKARSTGELGTGRPQ